MGFCGVARGHLASGWCFGYSRLCAKRTSVAGFFHSNYSNYSYSYSYHDAYDV